MVRAITVLTICKRVVVDERMSRVLLASMVHARRGNYTGSRHVNILHRLTFARGSEALDFVRTLRELNDAQIPEEDSGAGPVLVYGALIVVPDAPAELYISLGALRLAHALGIERVTSRPSSRPSFARELPADMALLYTASLPDEITL